MKTPSLKKIKNLSDNSEIENLYKYASGADSNNTKKAYNSDLRHFGAWCKKRNKPNMPTDPDAVALYIKYCSEKLKLKISTVKRRLNAISSSHRKEGLESPTSDWLVKSTLKRLERELGRPAVGKKAILVDDLKKMIDYCAPTLQGTRDKAILLIGFAGAFRRSELAAISLADLTVSDDGLVIIIKGSKTDQKRNGRKVAIPYGKHKKTCPVNALLDWIDLAKIQDGFIFRGLTKHDTIRSSKLSDRVVAEIVKKYTKLIGKYSAFFSGHSLRSGFATASSMAGASEASIQKQTGHKNLNVLRRYIRDGKMFRDNAASKLGL